MWQTDTAPAFGFESLAKAKGIHYAREQFARHEFEWKRKQQEANAIEHALARRAEKRGVKCSQEMDAEPQWQIARHTFIELHRASMSQKGCVGGEYLNDDDYMKFFLKRHPQCDRRNSRTGRIMSGWNPSLDAAATQGREERQKQAILTP